MKAKAVKKYSDIVLKRVVEKDEVIDVTESRGKYLQEQGMAEIIEDTRKADKKDPAK